jgi:hypothetical protein
MEKVCAPFIAVLFHSATNAHFLHLQSRSYSQHKALQKYYENIVDLTDRFAETYQGCYDIITDYPSDFHTAKEPIAYLTKIKDFVDTVRKDLPQDTQLQNIVDEIAELLDSTLYRLRFLK